MFSKDFEFGVATSSYQIEGTKTDNGYLKSIWDSFSDQPGAVIDGSDGKIACKHIEKYKEDVAMIKELGVDTYRFSISWPRIMPEEGVVSTEGLNFYKKLLKELRSNGIRSSVTMYHWDLPQWVYDKNKGWPARDTAYLFLDYAKVIIDELDELADYWVTLNEPFCSSYLGYYIGVHAPGHKSPDDYLRAAHHLNLAHGLVVEYYKSKYKKTIGIVLNLSPAVPINDSYANKIAADMQDACVNRVHLDPIFRGMYPNDYIMRLLPDIKSFEFIQKGDLDIVSVPIDFLGVNYYTRSYVEYDTNSPLLFREADSKIERTAMGWEVTPGGLYDIIKRVRRDYTSLPIFITENGSAWEDELEDGNVNDIDRIDYLDRHLTEVVRLNKDGMNVAGYYAWSFMDNFEWAYGYSKRFGLVYVDYETQKRYPKDSYYRYMDIIKRRMV